MYACMLLGLGLNLMPLFLGIRFDKASLSCSLSLPQCPEFVSRWFILGLNYLSFLNQNR